ncbi:HupE/UreJ family protein [Acinetobacter sp. ANC 4173]|uniref:HupE/UreJ family protein n=1 Tax=Acinetobacter sp. ANC 4173 TaxID=2529837 RepID=UPI0010398862|nr:HupE/UreJ family protein [Acinetobacter sp. ANC 4173]TCB77227.1 HupE/UreJ family protein [Acinetobacter sp. ANC 4173]
MTYLKRTFATLVTAFPMWAMAHPGHEHQNSFMTGFIHPFTGLDHLMMAIAFGVLLWSATTRWKLAGLVGLMIAMVSGFALGQLNIFSSSIAEYGIVFSLSILAIALWTKASRLFVLATIIIASFHGMAHGIELSQSGHVMGLVLGMVVAMSCIYAVGLALGALVQKYVPNGKKIIGGIAALVALIGLA